MSRIYTEQDIKKMYCQQLRSIVKIYSLCPEAIPNGQEDPKIFISKMNKRQLRDIILKSQWYKDQLVPKYRYDEEESEFTKIQRLVSGLEHKFDRILKLLEDLNTMTKSSSLREEHN